MGETCTLYIIIIECLSLQFFIFSLSFMYEQVGTVEVAE